MILQDDMYPDGIWRTNKNNGRTYGKYPEGYRLVR